jgi:hypothetical protein
MIISYRERLLNTIASFAMAGASVSLLKTRPSAIYNRSALVD